MAKKNQEISVTVQLRDLLRAHPFVPFDIRTTDGDTFHVFHPDFCMISPRGDMATLHEKEDGGARNLNLRQVVSFAPKRDKKGPFAPIKR